jgi:hypothetical protein
MSHSSISAARLLRGLLGAATLGLGLVASSWAMPITKQLVVKVVTVCNTAGTTCASHGPAADPFYEAEADKIWAQAGIDIKFVDIGTKILDSGKFTGASGVGDFTGALAGPGTTMYLVGDLVCGGCTLFGEAYLNAGGLVINMGAVTAFNLGIGRLDTIAHELGHNLAIGHTEADNHFLMHSGSTRFIPSSLGEICPDGPCYDLLPADQIALARRSSLLIDFVPDPGKTPEPGALALVALALMSAGVARRRRV